LTGDVGRGCGDASRALLFLRHSNFVFAAMQYCKSLQNNLCKTSDFLGDPRKADAPSVRRQTDSL
jgi:hypothetical protein